MCQDGNKNKGDKDMGVTENKDKFKEKKQCKRIPHLKAVDGKVVINEKDPAQVKWFKEFKK